jgi:hypothetical protein
MLISRTCDRLGLFRGVSGDETEYIIGMIRTLEFTSPEQH